MLMKSLLDRFEQEPALVVISPATASSNGISHEFRQQAGKHFIDVGIAEEHAISLACGIARGGGSPIVATSSTFFQRAYDQIQQEMSLNGSAVTLLEFASGISGTDVTHSGTFDIPLLGNIPELTCLAPTSGKQLLDMFAWASGPARKPVLIRMPGEDVLAYERAAGVVLSTDKAVTQRTAEPSAPSDLPSQSAQSAQSARTLHPWSRYRTVHEGSGVALLGLGNAYPLACDVAHILRKLSASKLSANQSLVLDVSDPTIIDPQQYSTLDTATLNRLHQNHHIVVTLEDSQRNGGWGQRISTYYASTAMRVMSVGADMAFTDRVALSELKRRYGMNADSIAAQLCLLATQECNSRGI
jgi:1-deoxy-D-xylulose-5-phosphate synthase